MTSLQLFGCIIIQLGLACLWWPTKRPQYIETKVPAAVGQIRVAGNPGSGTAPFAMIFEVKSVSETECEVECVSIDMAGKSIRFKMKKDPWIVTQSELLK